MRIAFRRLAQTPGFTTICVLTLALGIGATTAVFTLVQQVLLRALPVSNPSELYRLGDNDDCCVNSGLAGDFALFSYDLYRSLHDNLTEFSELAGFQARVGPVSVRRPGEAAAEPSFEQLVSGNYFQMFAVRPVLGRALRPDDDRPGAPLVAVVSYRTWEERFGADPAILGAPVAVNDVPCTIVGVAPPEFYGDTLRPNPPDFWMPIAAEPLLQPAAKLVTQPESHWLYAIGRMKPGIRAAQVSPHATAVLRQWLATAITLSDKDRRRIPQQSIRVASAAAGVSTMRDRVAPTLRLLLAVSAAVLLIACANLANLMLARGLGRRLDVAVRAALGAPRRQLIGEALGESLILSVAGGLAGLAVATLGARGIVAMAFRGARYIPIDPSPSPIVLGFATAVSLLAGVTFGLVPAVMNARSDPIDAMRGAGRVAGDRSSRLRQTLVVLQVALSLVLVVCAALLARSLYNLQQQDFGFATAGRYVVRLNASLGTATPERLGAIYRALPGRLGQIPGVESVAFSQYSPMEGDNWSSQITVEGHGTSEAIGASWLRVSPRYFETIGTRLVRGRAIDERDTPQSAPVAIVNETFAKTFFGIADPIGRHLGFADVNGTGPQPFEIVGIVADAKYQNARRPAYATFFLPYLQAAPVPPGYDRLAARSNILKSIELRLNAPVANLEPEVRRGLAEIDPGLTVLRVVSLDEQVALNFNTERLIATLTSGFGAMALLLACLGLYGVTTQMVTARTRDIGVRMAIGASPSRVVLAVLRGALLQVAMGFVLGAAAAAAAGRLLEQQLYGVTARDPRVLIASALILALCATVAALIPAMRAARVDPIRALRSE